MEVKYMADKEKTEKTNDEIREDLLKMQAEIQATLQTAQKTADDIIANAKKAAEQKPVGNNVVQKQPEKVEMVPIKLFKDGDRYKSDLTVALNGKTYTIQRGKVVMVPKGVAEIIDNSQKQDIDAALYRERKEDEYAATLK
jgi:hypothetical protein